MKKTKKYTEKKEELLAILAEIQQKMKVAKEQNNAFAKYKYRTCSDIFMAVKPFLDGATLTISDKLIHAGERYYIKATATLTYEGQSISVEALAREADEKKGMDVAQVTGTSSTYARKYALNGLFAIDDSKDDPDHGDNKPVQISSDQIKLIESNYVDLETTPEKISAGVAHISNGRTKSIKGLFSSEAQVLIKHQNARKEVA